MKLGLTSSEAKKRLEKFGLNEISTKTSRSFFATTWEILTEPMLLLLLAAAFVYLIIGDLGEGLLLAGFAVFSVFLVIYQQRRSDNALQELAALSAPNARVFRDGKAINIPAKNLVCGDVILIEEGERIPADGKLIQAMDMLVDESLLTGESIAVRKTAISTKENNISQPGGDDQPFVFSSTLLVRGQGFAEITHIGHQTHAGKIGVSLAEITPEKTRLQNSTAQMVSIFGAIALLVSLAVLLAYGLIYNDWLQGVLSGIAVAMSMLPEEFPVALMVFFAIGTWRLAQKKVLVRRPAIIEMLGATTVLCVDKTGTLTKNQMRISKLDNGNESFTLHNKKSKLPEEFYDLIEAAYLATSRATIDPMDQALESLATSEFSNEERLHLEYSLEREYGITPELLAVSQAWQDKKGDYVIATKGAPEAIAKLCDLDKNASKKLISQASKMAKEGLRVLGVAIGKSASKTLPDSQSDFNFALVGLIGFHDPVRETVPAAVAQAKEAGISVKMITGDFPQTASAIAKAAGLDMSEKVLTGAQMAKMNDEELSEIVTSINIYARMMPKQKLRLVQALKRNGEVVAMTGDGVNDAPALKAAHIGIAMGQRGTDVAREAAGIVLLDEDFGRIVIAVRIGRRIFDNLRKVMIYISSVHVSIAGLALLPLIFGMPPLLFPAHVVLIEMIIDPMSSISFETTPDEPDLMQSPPRPLSEPLVNISQISFGLIQGASLLAACFTIYWLSIWQNASLDQARALVFISMSAGNLALVRVNDSRTLAITKIFAKGHLVFWIIAIIASAIIALCIFVPSLREIFKFEIPQLTHAIFAIIATLIVIFTFDFVKLLPFIQNMLGHVNSSNKKEQS
jgi:Ca2+-transporting ATPase